jgi:hypothetical protein
MLQAVILDENVFRFVNVLSSLVGVLAAVWIITRPDHQPK